MDKRTNEETDKWTNGPMDRWTNGRREGHCIPQKHVCFRNGASKYNKQNVTCLATSHIGTSLSMT